MARRNAVRVRRIADDVSGGVLAAEREWNGYSAPDEGAEFDDIRDRRAVFVNVEFGHTSNPRPNHEDEAATKKTKWRHWRAGSALVAVEPALTSG